MPNLNSLYPYKLTDLHGGRGVCVPVKPDPVSPPNATLKSLFPPSQPRKG